MPGVTAEFNNDYLPGHTYKVHKVSGDINVRITAARPHPSHRHDFGALTAGTVSTAQQCTHIQVADGQFARYRFIILGAFDIELKHPQATLFWAPRGPSVTVGATWRARSWEGDRTLSPSQQEWYWMSTEFWLWEDEDPRFDIYPLNSAGTQPAAQGHVEFQGWRYGWEELEDNEAVQGDIWVDKFPA